MKSWTYKNIEWFYDEDGDLSSWKSPEQLDKGFRLPTIHEVLTLLDYDKVPLLAEEAPFSGIVWTKHSYYKNGDLRINVSLENGQVYPATQSNRRTFLLVRD